MSSPSDGTSRSSFRQFFLRGLGILLPTVLTIWILVAVYNFVDQKIADPINRGMRHMVVTVTPWPRVAQADLDEYERDLTAQQRREWQRASYPDLWLERRARQEVLRQQWRRVSIGDWAVLDLIGLLVAVVLIYMVGVVLGSYIGHHIWRRGEAFLQRLPLFKQVYPYVKEVTDFLFGDAAKKKFQFNRVVAVEYPRKGLWSIGLVTGNTMQNIQDKAKTACMTVFVPSSPTPFTGYVITVPITDTIELPISIDDALRFTVSGGVIVPPGQMIPEKVDDRPGLEDASGQEQRGGREAAAMKGAADVEKSTR